MGKRISDWLRRVSTGPIALAGLLVFLLFTILVLPRQAAQADATAEGAGSPDMSFFYTPGDLYRMAQAYGEEGRQAYVRARFTFDLVWPLVYTVFLTTAIGWVYGRAFAPTSPWQIANLAPIAAALFDLGENLSTSLVMLRFPERTPVAAILAPLLTAVKWSLVGGSMILLLAGTGAIGWKRVRKGFARPGDEI